MHNIILLHKLSNDITNIQWSHGSIITMKIIPKLKSMRRTSKELNEHRAQGAY